MKRKKKIYENETNGTETKHNVTKITPPPPKKTKQQQQQNEK